MPAEGEGHTGAEQVDPAGGGTTAVSTVGLTSPTITASSQPAASGGERGKHVHKHTHMCTNTHTCAQTHTHRPSFLTVLCYILVVWNRDNNFGPRIEPCGTTPSQVGVEWEANC